MTIHKFIITLTSKLIITGLSQATTIHLMSNVIIYGHRNDKNIPSRVSLVILKKFLKRKYNTILDRKKRGAENPGRKDLLKQLLNEGRKA